MLRSVLEEDHTDAENGLERGKMGSRETSKAAAVLTQMRNHEQLN